MAKSKRERVEELVRRLDAAVPSATAEDALAMVTTVLDRIEDEYSDVPNDPSSPFADERIWPPIAKYHFAIPGRGTWMATDRRDTRRSFGRTALS